MTRLRALTLALIALLVVGPGRKASTTKTGSRSSYAAGEVIVKLKSGARQLEIADAGERLMSISRLVTQQSGEIGRAEPLIRSTTNQRISEIISGRGLDRMFV